MKTPPHFGQKYTKRERKGEENKAENWRQLKTPITRENYNACMIRTFNVSHRMFSGVAYGAGGAQPLQVCNDLRYCPSIRQKMRMCRDYSRDYGIKTTPICLVSHQLRYNRTPLEHTSTTLFAICHAFE